MHFPFRRRTVVGQSHRSLINQKPTRLAAFAAVVVATTATIFIPQSVAAAADNPSSAGSGCVGLVVDAGKGDPITACVPFHEGMTGDDVLKAAKQNVGVDSHGLLCQINQFPDKCSSDNTHYWSYFHRAPGADDPQWTVSQDGAATYRVHAGESEGWAYQDGKNRNPAAVSYQKLAASNNATESNAASSNKASASSGINPVSIVLATISAILVLIIFILGISRRRSIRNASDGS